MVNDFFTICWGYTKNTLKVNFQYKINAFILSLAVFLRESTTVIVIYLSLLNFGELDGWNVEELFFLYSFVFITYGMLIVFFTGLRDFEKGIQSGAFDRILVRPRGVLFQVITSNVDWLAAIGHGMVGVCLLLFATSRLEIVWSIRNISYYIFAVIGGVLLQGAIFLIIATCSFWVVKTRYLNQVFYHNVRKFAAYPLTLYPKGVQFIMLYVVPFAFVNYFPTLYFLDEKRKGMPDIICIYLSPIVGGVLFCMAYIFWKYGIKRYHSTGN